MYLKVVIIKDHLTNVLCILHVGKNVQVKLEKHIIISCYFGTLFFYTLISSNTTLRYMSAQGRKDGRGFWNHITHVIVLTFKEIKHLWDYRTVGLSDRRTIGLSDYRTVGL
jgi:hypothetical protein